MLTFDLKIDMTPVHKTFKAYQGRLATKRKFMSDTVFPIVKRELALNFIRRGRGAAGRPSWEELSESRQKQRRLMGINPKRPILIATGKTIGEAAGSNLQMSFRGETLKITPAVTGERRKILTALHHGIPHVNVDAFGRGRNTGKYTIRTTKTQKPHQYRLPTRPFLFITISAWRDITRRGKRYFTGQ